MFYTASLNSLKHRTQRFPSRAASSEAPRAATGKDRNVACVCSLITLSLLLAIPGWHLLYPQTTDATDTPSLLNTPLGEYENGFNAVTASAVRSEAEPFLARLAPVRPGEWQERQVSMMRGIMGRPGGGTQYLWCITCTLPDHGREINLRYDAGSGRLIQASMTSSMTTAGVSGKESLTAGEASAAARRWLPKLGLAGLAQTKRAQTQPSAVVPSLPPLPFPPEQMRGGNWRVWLQVQDMPDGQPLTVEVRMDGGTGDLISATVIERCPLPQRYLPRCLSGSLTNE